jgi:hypothetical protein
MAAHAVVNHPRRRRPKARPAIVALVGFLLVLFASLGPVHAGTVKLELDATHAALGRVSTGLYDPLDIYFVPGGIGVAFLLPPTLLELPRGGITGGLIDYRGTVNAFGGGWSFVTAGADLAADSILVTAYDVFGGDFVGHDGFNGVTRPRGVAVRVPDAKAPAGDVHWVQVIRDNHNITDNAGHGNDEHIVDTASPAAGAAAHRSPYYDDGGAADSRNFFDFARRLDEASPHYWIADLHLVTGPAPTAPGEVTIYNGFRYGWANFTIPGSFFQFHDLFHQKALNIDALEAELGIDLTGITMDMNDIHDEFDREFALLAVPLPSSAALFVTGALLLVVLRKRKAGAGLQ